MKRFLRAVVSSFSLWLLSAFIFTYAINLIRDILYKSLHDWFPDVFVTYNYVTERANYDKLENILTVISILLLAFIISYLSVRFDNERSEYIIRRTEGMYTLREGCEIYFPRYIYTDLCSAVITSIPLAIAFVFASMLPENIPKILEALITKLLLPTGFLCELFGTFGAIAFISVMFLAFRIMSGVVALSKWRALWLSDTFGSTEGGAV